MHAQALISLKEARLEEAKLREARLLDPTPPSASGDAEPDREGVGGSHSAGAAQPTPSVLRRRSSSLVNIEVPGPNTAPLGCLQPNGRREYLPSASTRFGARSYLESATDSSRRGLIASGLPASLVARWHAGSISGELALREILDAVCRARSGRDASSEERELSSMTQVFSADGSLALGGPLGGLVGGLPAPLLHDGGNSAANLAPLRALLLREPDAVTCDALRMFTRQLLTGAESEAGAGKHALTVDLAKLSAEELNLAFRRACLKHHPNRPDGSLGALLCVHFNFELVSLTWAALATQIHSPERRRSSPSGARGGEVAGARGGASSAEALDDVSVLEEVRRDDKELGLEAEHLDKASLDALNVRAAARAAHLGKIRDMLDGQLEALQGVGAYAIIGCEPQASDKVLAAAYRDAARRLHPDRGGDKASFQRLQAAYEQVMTTRKASGRGGGEGGGADEEREARRAERRARKSRRRAKKEAASDRTADGGSGDDGPKRRSASDGGGVAEEAAEGEAGEEGVGGAEAEGAEKDAHEPSDRPSVDDGTAGERADEDAGADEASKVAEAAEAAEEEEVIADGAHDGRATVDSAASEEAEAAVESEGEEEGNEGLGSKGGSERRQRRDAAEVLGEEDKENAEGQEAEGRSAKGRRRAEGAAGGGAESDAYEEGELEAGELPGGAAAAAAAAEAEARAALDGSDDEVETMACEEMCNVAEQAAEAARACAASSRIGKRVCDLGSSGWGVLCDCAQTVLRTSRAASGCVMRVGHSAMSTPSAVTEALDNATNRKLDKRAEREIRQLMEAILGSVRLGREATRAARECVDKAADGAQIVLSLTKLPPNPERLTSAVGADALLGLMTRVADVLAEMAAAVGEAAEHAMSAAVAVEAMHRQSTLVSELASAAAPKPDEAPSSSDGSSSDDEEEDVKKAAAEAKKKADEEAEARRQREAAKAEAEREQVDPYEASLGPAAKERLQNARLLRKLSAEVRESQQKLREIVCAAPQLLPGVSVAQKEDLFQQLAEVLASLEQPIAQRWYESGPAADGDALGGDDDALLDSWVVFVSSKLAVLFHAADAATLPVPASLGARVLRQAALVDSELTAQMLRSQLLQRVMLFAPEVGGGAIGWRQQRPQLRELSKRLESAAAQLVALGKSHAAA